MNEINTKLNKEIKSTSSEFKAEIESLKVNDDFPEIKRTFTYRKSAAIKSNDLGI